MPILLMTSLLLAAEPADFGTWDKAVARFSPQVAKGLPAESLAQAWASVIGSAGAFQQVTAAEPRVHGLLLLAGATRKQWQLVVEQTRYMASLESKPTEAAAALITHAEESAKRLDDPKLKPDDVVDGIPGVYWLDLRDEDPAQVAAKLKVPMLVLQGERATR